jgi:predicted nucleotidyltransferase
VYKVADATVEDGPPAAIEEVVVFEALFAGMADPGDRILARGQVEVDAAGRGRLVVGSAAVEGGGTLRVLASAPTRAGSAPG